MKPSFPSCIRGFGSLRPLQYYLAEKYKSFAAGFARVLHPWRGRQDVALATHTGEKKALRRPEVVPVFHGPVALRDEGRGRVRRLNARYNPESFVVT
jgi:hypothetical protein